MSGKAKRGGLAIFASGVAAVASLAVLPATPALASTSSCSFFTVGSVSFDVCTNRVSSTRGQAKIIVTNGTYVSGTLYLETSNGTTDSGCTSKIYAGNSCSFSETRGSGEYQAEFDFNNGDTYASDGLYIS
jgi:hypothetical protein